MLKRAMMLGVVVLLLLAGCKPLTGPVSGDPSQKSSNLCEEDVTIQTCWLAATAPGYTKRWLEEHPDPLPGFHRVIVLVDVFDAHGVVVNLPVHMLAKGKTSDGQFAVDARTGSPYSVETDITTPDTMYYDLGPGVVLLSVEGIVLGGPGAILTWGVSVDGVPYPSADGSAQNPTVMGGIKRPLSFSFSVVVP